MSQEFYVEFRYEDLVRLEETGQRPRGYVASVLRSAKKSFGTVYMSLDAYKAFVAQYSPRTGGAVVGPREHRSSSIVVPKAAPKPILGPTGKPLQTGCCGGGSRNKELQVA